MANLVPAQQSLTPARRRGVLTTVGQTAAAA